MKKFFVIATMMLVFVSISFGIDVPKDSIYRFISETALKNNLKNPDSLVVGQEIFIYFGEYAKLPTLVKIRSGDNLTKVTKKELSSMSETEKMNRNLAYDMLENQKISFSYTLEEEVVAPHYVWPAVVIISFVLIFLGSLVYKLRNKKSYPKKRRIKDFLVTR